MRRAGHQVLVLLIRDAHRNWGFPKGHLERGEEARDAALREVREETGLSALELIAPLETIRWTFTFRGRRIHKTCHFFAVGTAERRTKPLRKEGITACRWVTFDQGVRMLTYDNARSVLSGARAKYANGFESAAPGTAAPDDAPETVLAG